MPSSLLRESVSHEPFSIEYNVYTFEKSGGRAGDRWLRHDSFFDMACAAKQAERLFATNKYCRVEVKQRYIDQRRQGGVDMTVRVYDRACRRRMWRRVGGAAALAAVCAACYLIFRAFGG